MIMLCLILLSICIVYLGWVLRKNGLNVNVTHNKFISLAKEDSKTETSPTNKSANIAITLFLGILAICVLLGFALGKSTVNYQQVNINDYKTDKQLAEDRQVEVHQSITNKGE